MVTVLRCAASIASLRLEAIRVQQRQMRLELIDIGGSRACCFHNANVASAEARLEAMVKPHFSVSYYPFIGVASVSVLQTLPPSVVLFLLESQGAQVWI